MFTSARFCAIRINFIAASKKNAPSRGESLWAVQTPQVFRADLIRRAYEKAYVHNHYGTDDASLVEYLGEKIKIVTGDYENIKITTPEDIPTAEQILQKRQQTHI